jgi:hypothetical protein
MGDGKVIYAAHSSLGPRLAVHLLDKYDVGHFIYIRQNAARTKSVLEFQKKEYPTSKVDEYTVGLLENYADLNLDKYEVVYEESEEDLEGEVNEKVVKELGLAARSRRANKEVLYMKYTKQSLNLLADWVKYGYKREKFTIKQDQIGSRFEDFTEGIIIVPGKFAQLGKLVEIACYLTTGKFPENVVYISQEVVKYFLPHGILVTDYFRQLNSETGELMVGKHIRELNTLRIFRELMDKYSSFSDNNGVVEGLTDINYDVYKKLRYSSQDTDPKYVLEERGELGAQMVDEVFGYLKVLEEFQQIVKTGDKDKIATAALSLFGSDEIYHLDAYDEEFISVVEDEFKRLEPIEPILEVTGNVDLERSKELFNLLLDTKNKLRDDNI